jgi:cytochrome c biogenesis protein CcdA
MAPMIGTQLLNEALLTVAFTVGLAILLSISIVASAALWRRHEHKAGVRELEQHLAAAVTEPSQAAAS